MASSKDNTTGGPPLDDDNDEASTVQMEPDQVAELHRRLASIGEAAAATPRAPQSGTLQPPAARPPVTSAPAAAPPAPARAPAPAPAPAAPRAAAKTASPAFVIAGIGAFLVCASLVLSFQPIAREIFNDRDTLLIVMGVGLLGYAMLAPGLSVAARTTNGLGGVAAVFVYLLVVGGVLQLTVLPEMRGDTRQALEIALFFLPAVAWLFIGFWGLASSEGAGGLAVTAGVFAVLGGAAKVAIGLMLIAEVRDRDIFELLAVSSIGGTAVAALLLGILFVGPLPARQTG